MQRGRDYSFHKVKLSDIKEVVKYMQSDTGAHGINAHRRATRPPRLRIKPASTRHKQSSTFTVPGRFQRVISTLSDFRSIVRIFCTCVTPPDAAPFYVLCAGQGDVQAGAARSGGECGQGFVLEQQQ